MKANQMHMMTATPWQRCINRTRRAAATLFALALSFCLCLAMPIEAAAQDVSVAAFGQEQPAIDNGQSATLLPDGRWLLLGGEQDGKSTAAAIIVDSCGGKTTTLPNSLLHARTWHSATLLPGGNVLVFGGQGADGGIVREAELFETLTQTFHALPGTGLLPRSRHTATLLADGRVLIAGGVSGQGEALSGSELWNAKTGKVEAVKANLRSPRFGHFAALLPNGSALIWGGQNKAGSIESAEIYDLTARSFKAIDAGDQSQQVMPSALPLAIRFSEPLQAATVATRTAALLGPLGRSPARVVPYKEGFLAFFAPLAGQSATLLPDGRWLLLGGEPDGKATAAASVADLCGGQSITLPNSLLHARSRHSATLLPGGKVLVFGGLGADGGIVQEAELFDVQSQIFQALPDSGLLPRSRHTATVLADGRVLIAGGVDGKGDVLPQADMWNPQTGKAEPFKVNLLSSRLDHFAALLPGGSVLLWGGQDRAGSIGSAELYDPQAQSFEPVSSGDPESLPNLAASASPPAVAGTLPEDGESGVPIDTPISARFAKPLSMRSIADSTLTLIGPTGLVAAKVTPAEDGLLAFLQPLMPLQPAARYTLFLSGIIDESGRALPFSATGFTTGELAAPARSAFAAGPSSAEEWNPGLDAIRGDWRAKRQSSPLQNLPPLQGAPGVTALAGQVLLMDGKAAANATLRIGGKAVSSDSTGRFLLSGIPDGRQTLTIDGTSANGQGKTYGVFEVRVVVEAGKSNTLPYTSWMPLIATRNEVTFPSPTASEVVVTTPQIPGLELHIPKDTVIRDRNGRVVTRVSITPIPVDRPPFPLPTGYVPVYFTVQPGGAYLQGIDSGSATGARVIYPNYRGEAPGTKLDFWSYDPVDKGWYVYGQGTVTADGRQIVPDPGVAIYEFTGAMINSGLSPPAMGPPPGSGKGLPGLSAQSGEGRGRPPCRGEGGSGACGDSAQGGEPVDLATGLFVYEKTDLTLADVLPLILTRTYRQNDTAVRPFGIGANFPYGIFLWSANQFQEADLVLPDGGKVHYVRTSPGTGYTDAVFMHQETATTSATPTAFYKSRIDWNGNGWDLALKDGTVYVFGENQPLQSIRDRYGNTVTITRASGGPSGNITRVTSPNGRYIDFIYDSSNRITQAKDNSGRTVGYAYDAGGNLAQVTDPAGGVTQYTYDSSHRMLSIKDPRGIVYLGNQYDANGRVAKQTLADGGSYQFAYQGAGSNCAGTAVTDPRGTVRCVTFNSDGYPLSDIRALGKPEQQNFTYSRQGRSNLLLSATDPLGRVASYDYDAMGNVTGITRLAGTPDAVTTTFTYEPNFNQVASITDPLGHVTLFAYDAHGNLTTATDPLGNRSGFGYNFNGQLIAATDPLSHTANFAYDGGDLVSITDPLGNTAKRFTDSIGRTVSLTDPLGNISLYDYDALSRVRQVTDPLGNLTRFAYDANGNLLTATDARGGVTSYSYDNTDRLASRTDPLKHAEKYAYDGNDNLVSFTDRKGQVASFGYDSLDRRTFAGFGTVVKGRRTTYASTINYTFDAGNRLVMAADSQSGTVTRIFDGLDRMSSETSPQGQVSYSYDAASRRTGMTVQGQSAMSYSYDADDRLTGITQGTSQVGFSYDEDGRSEKLTLPKGIEADYEYDAAGRPTGINYSHGDTALGDLSYSYDAAGRRISMGGSLARTGLPQAVTSASYDAANRLTNWGGTRLSYDANGNLTREGRNNYSWDARNRLSSMAGASFGYDPFGRRISKTVAGTSTGFLYDGIYVVQELTGTIPKANLFTGFNIDEIFSRTDSAGARYFLDDALGSTLALTDSTGAIRTSYSYDPYGNTTATGAASSNSFQYTGRENDGTGLYFYRARYYSSLYDRFISEDPIGFAGGINSYAYVGGNPINTIDPLGLWQFTIAGGSGYGALVTFGKNSGQWNFGAYFGAGKGFSFSINPKDTGCQTPRFEGGLRGQGLIGLGENIQVTSEIGFSNSFAEVVGHAPGTLFDLGISENNGRPEPIGINIGFGESAFFGVGGTVYFSHQP